MITYLLTYYMVVVRRSSGSALVSINEVNLRIYTYLNM